MRDILTTGLAQLGLTPPADGVDKLCAYGHAMLEQNKVMNLTAITDPEQVARLHFLDCAAVLAYLQTQGLTQGAPSLMDVGTGAGFPGVPLKILWPQLRLTLLDSLGKRVLWLADTCKALSLDNCACLHARAEEQALLPGYRDSFDLVTSRAVASLPLLCELCLPYVKVGGRCIAMKSVGSQEELEGAKKAIKCLGGKLLESWDYQIPGTDVTHRLVVVEKFAPTPKGYPRSWGKIKRNPL